LPESRGVIEKQSDYYLLLLAWRQSAYTPSQRCSFSAGIEGQRRTKQKRLILLAMRASDLGRASFLISRRYIHR